MRSAPPLFLPFADNLAIINMGLSPLASEYWITVDNQFEQYAKNKRALYRQNPKRVFSHLPQAAAAQRELTQRIYSHLETQHPEHLLYLNQKGFATHSKANLWQTSLWVQDDLCLMQPVDGNYCLTAASLCAPSGWNLTEKMGKPIDAIHAAVPNLNARIGKQINNTFSRLRPLQLYQRFNWSLKASNQLALFADQKPTATNDNLFLRVERQSLMRLPSTKAIAFTIRVYIYPMPLIAEQPNAIAALKKAISQMSDEEMQYKSMQAISQKFMQAY